MPRYDYKCEAKGHVFEVTQSFTDDPVAFCPEDGSKAERQLSVPHVIYKGSGFYTTDYKNGGNSSGSSTSATANSGNGSESKSESGSGDSSKPSSSSKSDTAAKTSGSDSKS